MFDEYNQQAQPSLGAENDYKQALAMLKPAPSAGASWPSWQGGAQKFSGGGGGPKENQDGSVSVSPEASAPQQATPSLGQEKPAEAMAMVAPKDSAPASWPSWSSGGGGGGGGGSMSQMASIAGMFM
jgi:hypothetical protein